MLTGKNIALRLMTSDDAQLVAAWWSDPEYMGQFNNVWPATRQEWERNLSGAPGKRETGGMYFIVDRVTGDPLGAIGYFSPFTLSDFFRGLEIWYQVHPHSRGRGIASQAAALLVNHLFGALPVERIQATIAVGNDASCRVVEKAGFSRDGLYRKVTFLHGHYIDLYLYAITRDDWQSEEAYGKNHQF